jgi:hypothetical protein
MDWVKVGDKVLITADIPIIRGRKREYISIFTGRIGTIVRNGRGHVEVRFSSTPSDCIEMHQLDTEYCHVIDCLNRCPECKYRFNCFTQ